jgi:hypothetical protein
MALTLRIKKADGSPATGLTFTTVAGGDSAHSALAVENYGVDPTPNALLVLEALLGPDYVPKGTRVTDELQGRFQITGQVPGSGGAAELAGFTQTQVVGYASPVLLPTIPVGTVILFDFWLSQPSTSTAGGSTPVRLVPYAGEPSIPLPRGVTDIAHGVLGGEGSDASYLISGGAITATGAPDDQIHRAPDSYLLEGVVKSDAGTADLTLDQNDGAAAALGPGESYLALVTYGADPTSPTITKGVKSATPTVPASPIDEVYSGAVITVTYQAGGTSVIGPGDIAQALIYGRYFLEDTGDLHPILHPGKSLTSNFMQISSERETLTLIAASVNRVWKGRTGTTLIRTTDDEPPEAGALWLWTATTDGTHITVGPIDKRTFVTAPGATSINPADLILGGATPIVGLDPSQVTGLVAALALFATLASPALTGVPTAPTAAAGTSTTQLATTAFVQGERPKRVCDIFFGDGSTNPLTLSKTPIFGTGVMADRTTTFDYAGPKVFRGTADSLTRKVPGSSGDANHYEFADVVTTPTELLLGLVLSAPELCIVDYETLDA